MITVPQQFHDLAQGQVIPLAWGLRVSFDRELDPNIEFGIYDVSQYDNGAIYAPSDDNVIQEWDFYVYDNYDDRVISLEWTREIDFPYSVVSAQADFNLNNFDDSFTPDAGSPISDDILPQRPLRLLAGYGDTRIQKFVGLTDSMPEINDRVASFHAMDFLSAMYELPLTETIAMANVTTDEVLAALFEQFGLTPGQFELAQGRNRIPFLFFEKGHNAGDVFRQLMQAELGNLWLDEQGIIRFEQRLLPVDDPVMVFDDSNVIDIQVSSDSEIINDVRITSDLREVQEFQPIHTKSLSTSDSDLFVIPANDTREYEAELADPCLSAVDPTAGFSSSVSWFIARDSSGNEVGNVSVAASELRTNMFVIEFENTNGFSVDISEMEIWGEPAKQYDTLEYQRTDDASITKFGEEVLEIDNNFFQSFNNCDSFALTILDAYSEHSPVIQMEVKGDFSLQLGDIIFVSARTFHHEYKVISMTESIIDGMERMTIKARKYTPRLWARYDISLYDDASTGVMAP